MPRKEFESFTRLDASDVNTFLMDQSVQTFAGTAARGSAIATPVEGMVTYLNDIDSLSVYNGTAFTTDRTIQVFAGTAARGSAIGTAVEGMYAHLNDTDTLTYYDGSDWVNRVGGSAGILQVVQTVKTDTATRTSTTFDDISGLSVLITPSSTSSKILVIAQVVVSANSDAAALLRLRRDSTDIYLGGALGNRTRVSVNNYAASDNRTNSEVISFLDSPNTTSAVTYKIQFAGSAAAAIYVNRTVLDTDSAPFPRAASSITVMEVAG
jgi:hypothetical protein